MEKRRATLTSKKIEIRAELDENNNKVITGVIPYNKRSVELSDWWYGDFIEKLSPGCFAKTLGDKAEVKALRNHNDTEILGNTKSGTLSLTDSDKGLVCRCVLPHTTYADDLFESTTRGDVTTMSFGMIVYDELWEEGDEGEPKIRTILNAKLDEVSFGVTYPAYPDTNAFESRTLKALDVKPEKMTENMKNKILSLAEEIRSADGNSQEENQQPKGTDGQSTDIPPEQKPEEPQTTPNEEEEQRKKAEEEQAQRDRDADAFLFSQAF